MTLTCFLGFHHWAEPPVNREYRCTRCGQRRRWEPERNWAGQPE